MNILPKKRWHVRTKDNIARVRRDEAQAREEELKKQQKLELAESEARINFLRQQSGLPQRKNTENTDGSTVQEKSSSDHIDLFADYKSHIKTSNKELEKEKKTEQEKYEKQIGYLTYLGQDTNEALKLRSWYELPPRRDTSPPKNLLKYEKDLKIKYAHDPLTLINALLPPEKTPISNSRGQLPQIKTREINSRLVKIQETLHSEKKFKKDKKNKRDKKRRKNEKSEKKKKQQEESSRERKKEQLEQLRKERFKREASEKLRQQALLGTLATPSEKPSANTIDTPASIRIKQKYNSQFNPELAKQNML